SSSAARSTSCLMRQAPSRTEYSEWTCRGAYGAATRLLREGRGGLGGTLAGAGRDRIVVGRPGGARDLRVSRPLRRSHAVFARRNVALRQFSGTTAMIDPAMTSDDPPTVRRGLRRLAATRRLAGLQATLLAAAALTLGLTPSQLQARQRTQPVRQI